MAIISAAALVAMAELERERSSTVEQEENGGSSASVASEGEISFALGESFRTYEELESKVKLYEQKHYVQLWKRDTRTVQAAQKRLNRPLSDRIKYYEVKYSCIHGGKSFKARGEGKRSTS